MPECQRCGEWIESGYPHTACDLYAKIEALSYENSALKHAISSLSQGGNDMRNAVTRQNDRIRLKATTQSFRRAMWRRLDDKEHHGFHGWDDPDDTPDKELWDCLRAKVDSLMFAGQEKRNIINLVDIANYAMFLWYRERVRDREDQTSQKWGPPERIEGVNE